jgi:hypothetical protein
MRVLTLVLAVTLHRGRKEKIMEKIDKDKDKEKRNSRVDLKKKISTRIGIGISQRLYLVASRARF